MKFTAVKELPSTRKYNPLDVYFKEFMAMNVKIAKVDFEDREYTSLKTAQSTLYNSARNRGYPITVAVRNNEIYFVRRDM